MNNFNKNINDLINQPYKYGFSTNIEIETIPPGLNEEIIQIISQKKQEPIFMLNFRLKAYKRWKQLKYPNWSKLAIPEINYQNIVYYSVPKKKKH